MYDATETEEWPVDDVKYTIIVNPEASTFLCVAASKVFVENVGR